MAVKSFSQKSSRLSSSGHHGVDGDRETFDGSNLRSYEQTDPAAAVLGLNIVKGHSTDTDIYLAARDPDVERVACEEPADSGVHKADGVEDGVLVDDGLHVPVVRFAVQLVEPAAELPVVGLLVAVPLVARLADVPFLVD